MSDCIVAIDGGGSTTTGVAVMRDGQASRLKPGRGCNVADGPGWQMSLETVLAQIPTGATVVLGVPGWGEIAQNDTAVRRFVEARRTTHVHFLNDVELAYRAAFEGGWGVLVLAGTGSMAMAAKSDEVIRAGGWGHWISDEGSAFWIGRVALALAVAEFDQTKPDTGFAARLMQTLDVRADQIALLEWIATDPETRARIGEVALHVDRLADVGDKVAFDIMVSAAEKLSVLARCAARRAKLPEPFRWCHAGSVFQSATVCAHLIAQLGPPSHPDHGTLAGGLKMAAELAGWSEVFDWDELLSD
ncbi:BadF/BadG/BcrA/BcrD ATPase family protein [Shimia abyssi]|uniref:N-acetylglucosamine kinase n=1 Tax=Shimia abyssi TaxID=1662395 RepID=A0A2P8F9W5_9RHOB|nr:BadF/BadG/BcrA/BcrD ATPase family protein [Shimia abyssi]PSL18521.1 N-acetylglucosamine kinase [Shimia abyssi]